MRARIVVPLWVLLPCVTVGLVASVAAVIGVAVHRVTVEITRMETLVDRLHTPSAGASDRHPPASANHAS
jgi:hypothetical protein